MNPSPNSTALLVVDVQKAFHQMEAAGARRNNPDAVGKIALMLSAFPDATWTFDRPDGRVFPTQQIHDDSPADLHEEFCTVVTTTEVVGALRSPELAAG